jgi:FkbM family methyltransferase
MTVTSNLNRIFRRFFGIEIHKTRASYDEARLYVLNSHQISLVIDGGANQGQYASRIRNDGYKGKILSIEPGSTAYEKLRENSYPDNLWDCMQVALGSSNGTSLLNLSSNQGMSSSLKIPAGHLAEFPTVKFEGAEQVSVITLEDLLIKRDERVFIKLDIQGSELEAIKGIKTQLFKVAAFEIEMTLVPMYQNESTLGAVINLIEELGFQLFSISEFGKGKNGQVTYFDILAIKN